MLQLKCCVLGASPLMFSHWSRFRILPLESASSPLRWSRGDLQLNRRRQPRETPPTTFSRPRKSLPIRRACLQGFSSARRFSSARQNHLRQFRIIHRSGQRNCADDGALGERCFAFCHFIVRIVQKLGDQSEALLDLSGCMRHEPNHRIGRHPMRYPRCHSRIRGDHDTIRSGIHRRVGRVHCGTARNFGFAWSLGGWLLTHSPERWT